MKFETAVLTLLLRTPLSFADAIAESARTAVSVPSLLPSRYYGLVSTHSIPGHFNTDFNTDAVL